MYWYDFYAIEKLWRKLREVEFDKQLEEESLYQIDHQDITKLSSFKIKDGLDYIVKPIIVDDNFEMYNKLVDKIYNIFLESWKSTENLFNKKSIDLIDISWWKDIEVMSGDYIKEQYKDILEELNKQVYIKLPSVFSKNMFNNSAKYLNLKLLLLWKSINVLLKENWNKNNCNINSSFFYVYFFDRNTKMAKTFFMDERINEIFSKEADNILINYLDDNLNPNRKYIEISGNRIPYIDWFNYSDLYKNYSFWKKILNIFFTFKIYWNKITIIPSDMNITNREWILFLFNLFKKEIEKLEITNQNKKRNRDIGILQLLYNVYSKINSNNQYKELSFIPYTFIFDIFKDMWYETYKTLDWITLWWVVGLLTELWKRINSQNFEEILEKIEKITSNKVCFSNYLIIETKWWWTFEDVPGRDFLKKIDFIWELLTTNDIDIIFRKYLWNTQEFIIKQKIKKFNKTSLSWWKFWDWEVYNLIELLLNKQKNLDKDLEEKYYQKNKALISILREQVKNSNSFLSNFIQKLKYNYYDLNKTKEYLEESLVFYVQKWVTWMSLDKKRVYLVNLLNNLNQEDLLYILWKILYGWELSNDEFYKWILYDDDKRFVYAGFINSNYKTMDKYKLIYDFISKVYFNYKWNELKKNRILLENIIYFLNHINDKEKIFIRILSNFVN